MPKTFCLLNHQLTDNQKRELSEKYAAQEVIYPPAEISQLWSQIAPETERSEISRKIIQWLVAQNAQAADLFIIQGEFGATFMLVDYALKNKMIALYATSRRVSKEVVEGETVRKEFSFEHIMFKEYATLKDN